VFLETILSDALRGYDDDRKVPSPVTGRWRNRLGSTMELTVGDNHQIHGTYHASVGEVDTKLPFPVVGFIEGEALSFCVDFGRRGSVASWSGHHVDDEQGERLVTLWHLARPVGDAGSVDLSRAMMAGADEFVRSED
jgi:hypothetical protein